MTDESKVQGGLPWRVTSKGLTGWTRQPGMEMATVFQKVRGWASAVEQMVQEGLLALQKVELTGSLQN